MDWTLIFNCLYFCGMMSYSTVHCDLKVSSSQAKINENLANYFFKTKANNKCYKVLKWTCKGLQRVRAVKSKPKAYLHFIVDPVLKIYETFNKQAKSLRCSLSCFILRHASLTFVCNLVPTHIAELKL